MTNMSKITRNQMGMLIEDFYRRVEIIEKDQTMSDDERTQLIKDMIGEFVAEYSGRVEGMDDRQLGEYVKEVLDRTKKGKEHKEDWR